ncbi:MAG: hypothetical protein IJU61_03910, partial [Victivallales bacterium]|nr:hypothetical protein [Victivallales bacterium]
RILMARSSGLPGANRMPAMILSSSFIVSEKQEVVGKRITTCMENISPRDKLSNLKRFLLSDASKEP